MKEPKRKEAYFPLTCQPAAGRSLIFHMIMMKNNTHIYLYYARVAQNAETS